MKKEFKKKLSLNKQTIAALNSAEMEGLKGGHSGSFTCAKVERCQKKKVDKGLFWVMTAGLIGAFTGN